ncbi:hypothetical protein TRIUR3_16807 [Triticum urartu]|uniref:Uncharacterized protein n=1 Tax=Triticum urartu TaxID=4572 RepID=M7ZHF3_TRIUA|nr:hypothetical protein TRIUR3_16807 [Triticum urartu]
MTVKLAGPCDVRHHCRCDLHCYDSLDHLLNQVVAHATPSLPRSTTNHIQDVHTRTTSPGYTAAAGALKDSLCTRAQRLSRGKQGRSPAQLAAMRRVSPARGHSGVLPGHHGTWRKESRSRALEYIAAEAASGYVNFGGGGSEVPRQIGNGGADHGQRTRQWRLNLGHEGRRRSATVEQAARHAEGEAEQGGSPAARSSSGSGDCGGAEVAWRCSVEQGRDGGSEERRCGRAEMA